MLADLAVPQQLRVIREYMDEMKVGPDTRSVEWNGWN